VIEPLGEDNSPRPAELWASNRSSTYQGVSLHQREATIMANILYRIGHLAGRRPWLVLGSWVLLAVSAIALNASFGGSSDESFSIPGAESQRAADAIEERFPQETLYTSNVIFHSEEGVADPATKALIRAAVADLTAGDHVVGVSDPYDSGSSTVSDDGRTAFATVAFDKQEIGVGEFESADKATREVRDSGIQVEYDGGLGYAKGDTEPGSEKIGLLIAIIVLAIAFGSLVAVSLPIVVALVGILVGTSAIGLLSGVVDMPEIASTVGLMIGLGVGIDYALFILARHRQNLDSGMSVPVAVARANATAGLSVLFAGATVVLAIAGLQVSGISMMTTMGWASAIMVIVTMLAAVTLLPALLGLTGRRVNSLRIPFIKQRPADGSQSKSGRWAARVVAHPVRYGVTAAVILAVLALPVFSMRLAFMDAGNDGPSTTTRKAYDLIADGYGDGVNGPLEVVVDTSGSPGADMNATVTTLVRALDVETGVASVDPPVLNEDNSLAIIGVTPTTAPQDEETSELLTRLRDDVIPSIVEDSGVDVMVTGNTALTEDVAQRLQNRMPVFLGAVIGLAFLVLMIVFRSVLVPLKAAVLNVLSVGAAYGVVVAVFQWGWGASLVGVDETVPIMPLAPMLMFAILFGLSMDYEVFLLSRVREHYLRHGDPKLAIVDGVRTTGRVITSAALIMIAVFGAFILMSDVTTKMFGVGLSLAILFDVTLVRMVLVPAAMSLLGHRAWWLPGWLDRLVPTIDLEGAEHGAPEPAADDADDRRDPALV
jgi:RND superfamily putative drug exporter